MIAALGPYPQMRDSGVEWLGEVPAHWQVVPNRAAFVEIKDRDHPAAEMLSVTIRSGVIRQAVLLSTEAKKDGSNLDKSAYKYVQPGDIAYNRMRAWQGAAGASAVAGIVSPAYVVQRPRDGVDSRFMHYLLRTPMFAAEAGRWSYGITSDMWSLRPEDFKRIRVCVPPLPEQAAIVRFIDHADRRIRRYIAAKKRLIALLNEQKLAVISRAVTRGLDRNVRLKPSGVESLPDVPAHWDVRKLKYLVTPVAGIQMGPFGASLTQLESHDTGFKLFGQENTISGDFGKGSRWLTQSQFQALQRYELRPGDLVLTRKGTIGRCRMVPVGAPVGIADSDTIRVRVDHHRALPQFIVMLLHHAPYLQLQFESVRRGAVIGGLNTATIAGLKIAVPPMAEQVALLDEIQRRSVDLDRAVANSDEAVTLVSEYHTRLIADVVRGRLDVRDAAGRLPDGVEEAEAFDAADAVMGTDDAVPDELDAADELAKA